MTLMLDKPVIPACPVKSSRWAWTAALLSPVAVALAIWMAFFILGDENIKWWGDAIVSVLIAGPPVAGVVLGIRSARSGNRMGAHAAAVAAGWVGFVLTFWYAANYPFNGESGALPLSLGALAAIVAAGCVETWSRRAGPTR